MQPSFVRHFVDHVVHDVLRHNSLRVVEFRLTPQTITGSMGVHPADSPHRAAQLTVSPSTNQQDHQPAHDDAVTSLVVGRGTVHSRPCSRIYQQTTRVYTRQPCSCLLAISNLVVTLSLTIKTDCNNFLNRLLFKDIR